MAERKNIVEAIDYFYGEIIEKYKELERQVAGQSKILTFFKKVDYKERIANFKELKKKAQSISLKSIIIDQEDELSGEAKAKFSKTISLFVNIIDAQVSWQTILFNKSEGEKVKLIDYKKAADNVQNATETLQSGLRSLDAVYANLEEN